MIFNSITFGLFLFLVFLIYWLVTKNNLYVQNSFLLLASYVFYGWWDWRLLLLLIFISLFNYSLALLISNNFRNKRNLWFILGIILNLGTLGFFKYFNFFIHSFIDLFSIIGYSLPASSIRIVLPVGISFYIFISLSYLIDIYKNNLKAYTNVVQVLLSLGFFPIILAGPIQRPSNLLPQIDKRRVFNRNLVTDGLRQILWGLFMKVVIADNLAYYVDDIFLNYSTYKGSLLLMGAVLYSIQIYADFSGYSDIAIGIAKLLGFNLTRNFAYPYFSVNIVDFWKKWHISLTSWFRDYVFMPLAFSVSWRIKSEKVMFIRSDMVIYIVASVITWFLTGLWHGANYTFLVWGMIHGLVLIIYRWQIKPREKLFKKLNISSKSKTILFAESLITLFIILIAWVFFRSNTVSDAVSYISVIFSKSLLSIPDFHFSRKIFLVILILTLICISIEWYGRNGQYGISWVDSKVPIIIRWSIYYAFIVVIFFFAGAGHKFIYFQF